MFVQRLVQVMMGVFQLCVPVSMLVNPIAFDQAIVIQ